MKEKDKFDLKNDLKNFKALIERSYPNKGIRFPLFDYKNQYKDLSKSLLRVSKSRDKYIEEFNKFLSSKEYKTELISEYKKSMQITRKQFCTDYAKGEDRFKHIIDSYPYKPEFYSNKCTKKQIISFAIDDFKKGHLLKKINRKLNKKDLILQYYEHYNYVQETDDESLYAIADIAATLIMDFEDLDIEIQDSEAEIIIDLNDAIKAREDSKEADISMAYNALLSSIKKLKINGSFMPFEMRMQIHKNTPVFCSTPINYFPIDNEMPDYFQEGMSGKLARAFADPDHPHSTKNHFMFTVADVVNRKKHDLSNCFYKENKEDLKIISEIQTLQKTNHTLNIDVRNSLKVCYELMKGYKESASLVYAEDCSREDFFYGWRFANTPEINLPGIDYDDDHYDYKTYFYKEGDGKISSNILKPNESYGRIFELIKDVYSNYFFNYSFYETAGTFMTDFFTEYDLVKTDNLNIHKKISDRLIKEFYEELKNLSEKDRKSVDSLKEWLSYEFQAFYEDEITKHGGMKKHYANLEKTDNYGLIKYCRERLKEYKKIKAKLNKSKSLFKSHLEEHQEDIKERLQATSINIIWDIPYVYQNFFNLFSNEMLAFGKGIDFFVDDKWSKSKDDEVEPFGENNVNKIEKILTKIVPKLREDDLFNQSEKIQANNYKNNLRIINKNLKTHEKAFIRNWVLSHSKLIYKGEILKNICDTNDGDKNENWKDKSRTIRNKKLKKELPDYVNIQYLSDNIFNVVDKFYKVKGNDEIDDRVVNSIKNTISEAILLIHIRPNMAGVFGNSISDENNLKILKSDKNKDVLIEIINIFYSFIVFKINISCEVFISKCMDSITRAVLFINGINPFFYFQHNPYDVLIQDLELPIKVFKEFQKESSEEAHDAVSPLSGLRNFENEDPDLFPINKILFIQEIIESIDDIQKYLKLMKSVDIHDFNYNKRYFSRAYSNIELKKKQGISNEELAVLAKKVSGHYIYDRDSLKSVINEYNLVKKSSLTKFIRDDKNENMEKVRKKLFGESIKTKELTVKQKHKIQKELKKYSQLHNITKEGNIDRDSAIQWLKDRTGNHIKLKDLHNYRIPYGIGKIGFYEFAKLSDWIGEKIPTDEILNIKPQ